MGTLKKKEKLGDKPFGHLLIRWTHWLDAWIFDDVKGNSSALKIVFCDVFLLWHFNHGRLLPSRNKMWFFFVWNWYNSLITDDTTLELTVASGTYISEVWRFLYLSNHLGMCFSGTIPSSKYKQPLSTWQRFASQKLYKMYYWQRQ